MQKKTRRAMRIMLSAGLLCAPAGVATAAVTTVFSDPFTDGSATGGTDPLGGIFYANANGGAAGTLSVSADAALPARGASNSNTLLYTPGGTFQSVVAPFSVQPLAVGDSITLTFDFHFTAAPAVNGAFRFGLHNDNGTPVTGNGAASDANDDQGYYASITTGAAGASAFRENGGTPSILGGTDRAQVGASSTANANVNGTEAHTALLTLTRTAAGTISLLSQIDSATVLNVTDTGATTFNFNELAISPAGNTVGLRLDNIVVTSTASTPEPGTLGSVSLAAAALLARRKRRAGTGPTV